MLHSSRVFLTTLVLLIAVLGCALPAITLQNPDTISTTAAETVIAGFTQVAPSATLLPAIQEATLTSTLELPTFTPTTSPTETLTATLVFTATTEIPQISVSVPTNCRNGPGKVYRMVGALLVGEVAQVYGRDPTGNYWYIRNPDAAGDFCWVWGQYATVTGSTIFLPVYTPPPTPTATLTPVPTLTSTPFPDFDISYSGLDGCANWWVEVEIENTGSIPFQSMGITVRDTVTDVVLASFSDDFTNANGCGSSNSRDVFPTRKTRIVSAPPFAYDPSGHKIRTTLILCSEDGQSGTCVTRTINFTP